MPKQQLVCQRLKGNIGLSGSATTSQGPTQITSGYALADKVAMRIQRINYFLHELTEQLNTSLDTARFGFCFLASQPTGGFLPQSPGVLDYVSITRLDMGTPATEKLIVEPSVTHDFMSLPGGGLLAHPAAFYTWAYTEDALAGSSAVYYDIFYTMEDITPDMWDELWKQIFVTQAA